MLTAYCIAELLDQLGYTDAAFRELQNSFDTTAGTPEPTDLGTLALYFDVAGRLHKELPVRHWQLAREALRTLGITLSDADSADPEKIRLAIQGAYRDRLTQT